MEIVQRYLRGRVGEQMKYFRFFNMFLAWNYEKEEEWLREMSKKGFEFVDTKLLVIYRFRSVEPKDVIYKLDYNPWWTKDGDSYLSFIEECGWTYSYSQLGWNYFKCDADKCLSEELYSSPEDKAKILGRLRKLTTVFTSIEAILLALTIVLKILDNEKFPIGFLIMWALIILEFTVINVKLYSAYKKKKKGL